MTAHHGPTLEAHPKGTVIDCGSCGYAHTTPLPTREELRRFYEDAFYSKEKPAYLRHMEEDSAWWSMVYGTRLETIERLRPGMPGRILDVGCSGGFFLAAARQRGWTALGFDAAPQAVGYARERGLDVCQGDANDFDFAARGPFDAVYMSFVLEHLPDPAGLLRRLRAAMAPGAVLCVEVPNDFNPFQTAVRAELGKPAYWVVPDHHLNYFTPSSLERLVTACGFRVEEREGTFPMELFLLMGDDYLGNDSVGRAMHAKRKQLELRWQRVGLGGLRQDLYRFLLSKGVGREVVLYARPDPGGPR